MKKKSKFETSRFMVEFDWVKIENYARIAFCVILLVFAVFALLSAMYCENPMHLIPAVLMALLSYIIAKNW